jgi:uncharacterized protein YbjT (DUF2867 family)
MTILVTTPTGHVGSHVVRLLVQAGVRPAVLARDPAKLDVDIRSRVAVRQGDLADAGFVREATRDAHALFWVDPTDLGADDPNDVSARLGGHAADAVRANGIPHVVFQSSVGAEHRHGVGLIDGLGRVEDQLDATGANVLHLRCGYFFTNLVPNLDALRAGTLPTTMSPEATLPWVHPRDIGEIVAARLLAAGWTGRAVQAVHGPADLSWAQVADILSTATDRTIRVLVQTGDEVRRGLRAAGLSERAAAGVVDMTTGPNAGRPPELPRTALSTTPSTLAGWAFTELRPALSADHGRIAAPATHPHVGGGSG